MTIIKLYSDIKQSKKLAEILPLESADMFLAMNGTLPVISKYIDDGLVTADETAIPCWSLAALLGVLPNNKHITTTLSRGGWKIEPVEYIDKWFCEYEDEDSPSKNFSVSADNPVDACYEVIIKLYELKML